jgi:hypothetical protein
VNQTNYIVRPHLLGLLAGLSLAAALVWSAFLVTGAWMRIAESQTIGVTGSAKKIVLSDLIVWRGSFTAEGESLAAAHRKLKADLRKVEVFLQTRGISNFVAAPISILEVRAKEKGEADMLREKTVGYRLSQSIEIRSTDVERIAHLSGESVALIDDGVVFTTNSPEYIYTKAGEAKIEMLAEATKDARLRADQIASQGGRGVAQLRSAKMGVFQITPIYSHQTSWEGMSDTSSPEKTITAVVTATFSMN